MTGFCLIFSQNFVTSLDHWDCSREVGGDSGLFGLLFEASASEGAISEGVPSDNGVHGLTGAVGSSSQGARLGLI